jgi:hypothetical protein
MIALLLALLLSTADAAPKKGVRKPARPPVVTQTTTVDKASEAAKAIPHAERLTANLTIQVDDNAAAQAKAIAAAEGLGGWFSALGADSVTLRVPTAKVEPLIDQLRTLGLVVDRGMNREELGPQLANASAALAARRDVLRRYFDLLAIASPDSVVSVESQIDQSIREIEYYEGQLRALTHRAAYAQVDVAFRFRDRTAPAPSGVSSFAWLNHVDLSQLLGAFRQDSDSPAAFGTARGAVAVAPEGFAPFAARRGAKAFAAVSPDDVVFRVRTMKNKPEADLAFWTEALRTRLVDAGYRLVGEGDLASAVEPGKYLELVAPDGERDARWLVGVYVDGRQITVVEAAGEGGRFAKRRDAVIAAIGKLQP